MRTCRGSPSLLGNTHLVGARVDDVGKGGPLWSPGAGGVSAFPLHVSKGNRTRATIKALPTALHLPRPYGKGISPYGWRATVRGYLSLVQKKAQGVK